MAFFCEGIYCAFGGANCCFFAQKTDSFLLDLTKMKDLVNSNCFLIVAVL